MQVSTLGTKNYKVAIEMGREPAHTESRSFRVFIAC